MNEKTNEKKFIYVKDAATCEYLNKLGYQLISKKGDCCVFYNKGDLPMNFDKRHEYVLSDILSF